MAVGGWRVRGTGGGLWYCLRGLVERIVAGDRCRQKKKVHLFCFILFVFPKFF